MNQSILVVAAHPDDEVLGCGGTIARHVAEGDRVDILFIADGVSSRSDAKNNVSNDGVAIDERQSAADVAGNILGVSSIRYANFPDNQLDTVPLLDVIKSIEESVEELKPSIIYTHNGSDLNVDHRVTYQAVLTAARPTPGQSVVKIYCFEVLSSTEWAGCGIDESFNPNYFVNVEAYVDKKTDALRAYDMEMREFPHSRSYESVSSLLKVRGSSVGVQAAEAFILVREVF